MGVAMANVNISAQNIEQALSCYSDYRDNWDQEGGVAPHKEALINATKFWKLIHEASKIDLPSVFLSGDGEINFIWDISESPVYIDVGFINSGYSYYAIDTNEKEILKDSNTYNEDDLVCLLKLLKIKSIKFR